MTNQIAQQFKKIENLLKESKNILITSHENPDADAVGSILALDSIFKNFNCQKFLHLPGALVDGFNFLPGFDKIENEIKSDKYFDFAFCLDYGDLQRLNLPFAFSEEKIITIDHHLEGEQKGKIKIIEPEISSTAEIIYWGAKSLGLEINKNAAICLLSGIISDTEGLKHIATTSDTFKVVSALTSKGISLNDISRKVLTLEKPLSRSKIWAEALSRIIFNEEKNFVFTWVSFEDFQKYQISYSDLDGISSLISTISNASFSLFLIEYNKGKIKGSLRSEPYKERNIIEIAKAFGGNGHPFAAGFKQDGSIEEVFKRVYNLIDPA